jgi:hypothetical protein
MLACVSLGFKTHKGNTKLLSKPIYSNTTCCSSSIPSHTKPDEPFPVPPKPEPDAPWALPDSQAKHHRQISFLLLYGEWGSSGGPYQPQGGGATERGEGPLVALTKTWEARLSAMCSFRQVVVAGACHRRLGRPRVSAPHVSDGEGRIRLIPGWWNGVEL